MQASASASDAKNSHMNIAFVDQKMLPGIGTYYDTISRLLAQRGNRTWLISSVPRDGDDYRKDGVQFVHVPSCRSRVRFTAQIRWDWRVARVLQGIEAEHGLDLVEFSSYLPEGLVYVYWRREAAVCIRVHEWKNRIRLGRLWHDPGDTIREILCWLQMARADLILPVSTALCDACIPYMGSARQARKIFTVRPGYDLDRLAPTAEPPPAYRSLEGRRIVLFVGRITEAKGTYNLIEAFRNQIAPRFDDAALVLVGVPEKPDQLKSALAGAPANVIHLDDVQSKELPAFYSHAYVFAAPSRQEGFGAVFVEALACGVPVISVARGGPLEIVVPEETGILCPDNSASAIARALERLLSDRDLRDRMARAARASVVDRFGLDRVAFELMERYREAAGRRHRRRGHSRRPTPIASRTD